MLERSQILKIVDDAYAARKNGDKDRLATLWAPDARFQIAGDASLISPAMPLGESGARETVNSLIDMFTFHEIERLAAVVDGNSAAVHLRITFSTGGWAPQTTELVDLWTIGDDGKVTSLTEFLDTAMLASVLEGSGD